MSRDVDDDAQDRVGLGRAYKSSGSSSAGFKSPGVDTDAGRARDWDWESSTAKHPGGACAMTTVT